MPSSIRHLGIIWYKPFPKLVLPWQWLHSYGDLLPFLHNSINNNNNINNNRGQRMDQQHHPWRLRPSFNNMVSQMPRKWHLDLVVVSTRMPNHCCVMVFRLITRRYVCKHSMKAPRNCSFALVWCSLVWFSLVWFGLVWFHHSLSVWPMLRAFYQSSPQFYNVNCIVLIYVFWLLYHLIYIHRLPLSTFPPPPPPIWLPSYHIYLLHRCVLGFFWGGVPLISHCNLLFCFLFYFKN